MPSRPRVLYASFDAVPAPKGASEHILQTVRAIARSAEVELMTLPGTLREDERAAAGALSPGVTHLPVGAPAGNLLQRALEFGDAVARRLLDREYAAVHVRSIWEGTPARLLQRERGYRLVYEVNGLPSVELRYHYPGVTASPDLLARLRAQERALLAAADRVLTPSHTTRKFLRSRGAGGERVRVVPNGADPERIPASSRPMPERPRVLYLGTLAPWQGVPFLLEAVALAAAEADLTLQVVGGGRGEWLRECRRLVRRLGLEARVSLEPPVPPEAVPALLAAADICAAPLTVTERNARQGCCPLKILEYMAAGRPIAAARLAPVCEVLEHEQTALLYKPDRPRRLAEALARLAREPELAARLGAAAARVARERYTWEHHNAAVAALYEELL